PSQNSPLPFASDTEPFRQFRQCARKDCLSLRRQYSRHARAVQSQTLDIGDSVQCDSHIAAVAHHLFCQDRAFRKRHLLNGQFAVFVGDHSDTSTLGHGARCDHRHDGCRYCWHVESSVSDIESSREVDSSGRENIDIRKVDLSPESSEAVGSPGVADFEIYTIVVDVLDGGVDDDRPVHDALDMHFNVAWVDTGNVRASLKLQDILIDPASIPDLHLWDEVDLPCSEQTLRNLRL